MSFSICYAPIIQAVHPIKHNAKVDISLAQSTKYKYEELVNFLRTEVYNEFEDESIKDFFEVCESFQ